MRMLGVEFHGIGLFIVQGRLIHQPWLMAACRLHVGSGKQAGRLGVIAVGMLRDAKLKRGGRLGISLTEEGQ